jgi:hypothetical protein
MSKVEEMSLPNSQSLLEAQFPSGNWSLSGIAHLPILFLPNRREGELYFTDGFVALSACFNNESLAAARLG